MCESGPSDSYLQECHSAECLIDSKREPNQESSLRANSHSTVKNNIVVFTSESNKILCKNSDYHSTKNSRRKTHASSVEWKLDGLDDEIGCARTSSFVSHEELRALTGCVTRGRMLFSPKSYQDESPSVLQVVSASTSDVSRDMRDCDDHKESPPLSRAPNSIPDSVSVQFDSACYDSETVCESSLKERQLNCTGLNVAAVSKSISECNINTKSTDSNRQCFVGSLSSSIPGELNTCKPQFKHRGRLPGLEHGSPDPSVEFPLSHAKDKSLHSSWPCHHFYHSKEENSTSALCSCSAKHIPHLTTPHQVTQLLRPKQHSYNPMFQGSMGVKPTLSSLASTLSVSSCHSASDPSLSVCDRPHISYSTGVDGQVFKDKTEVSFKNNLLPWGSAHGWFNVTPIFLYSGCLPCSKLSTGEVLLAIAGRS